MIDFLKDFNVVAPKKAARKSSDFLTDSIALRISSNNTIRFNAKAVEAGFSPEKYLHVKTVKQGNNKAFVIWTSSEKPKRGRVYLIKGNNTTSSKAFFDQAVAGLEATPTKPYMTLTAIPESAAKKISGGVTENVFVLALDPTERVISEAEKTRIEALAKARAKKDKDTKKAATPKKEKSDPKEEEEVEEVEVEEIETDTTTPAEDEGEDEWGEEDLDF